MNKVIVDYYTSIYRKDKVVGTLVLLLISIASLFIEASVFSKVCMIFVYCLFYFKFLYDAKQKCNKGIEKYSKL